MYAKYTYTSGATLEQIHDDMFELFVGETDKSNLSAGCDQANTEILTTYSTSPWEDWDDVSTTERIMRLESTDDTGRYKYAGWHSGGSNELAWAMMESWNNITHLPTNEFAAEFSYQSAAVLPGTGGIIHIHSSQFCTVFMHQRTDNVWGNSNSPNNWGSLGIFEIDRTHPSLAIGDMPNWFMSSTAMFWGDGDTSQRAVFWQGRNEVDVIDTPFRGQMNYPGRDVQYWQSNSYAVTGGVGTATALSEIGAPTSFGLEPIIVSGSFAQSAYDLRQYYGNVSARCDIWMMPVGSQDCGTLVILDGLPYIVFKAGYSTSTAGAQIGGKFIVPYG